MSSYDVSLYAIRARKDRPKPYQVRWAVAGRQHSESFLTKALAESYRAGLIKAARDGEAFDEISGLQESRARDVSWYEHARAYAAHKWPRAAAKTRKSIVEALTTVTVSMLGKRPGRPADKQIRAALYGWAFNPSRDIATAPDDVREALAWVSKASLRVSALRDTAYVRRVLDGLTVKLDGQAAAATTVNRKRTVFYNALGYAVEQKLLPANPIDQIQWTAPEVAESVDRRSVPGPELARKLIAAVAGTGRRGEHLVGFFGCLYFAGLRPAEAVALRRDNCDLPAAGWGRLILTGSEPRAARQWTNDGQAHDPRELKRRARNQTRTVPIPPELVAILRQHVERHDVGEAERMFHTEAGGPVQETGYYRAWRNARKATLTVAQQATPLARRPYDLRHAAASLWLNAGVPATEVARRLGHSVAVLLKVYANCIEGDERLSNERIGRALGADRSGTLSVAEAGDVEPAAEDCGPVVDQDGGSDLETD